MLHANLILEDLAATERLGLFFATRLRAGDVLALRGALGAGKSALARAIIQNLCPDETDIPSPTFTLVQTYEAMDGTVIQHFDLYRLDAPEDAFALGIEDAFVESICLVEWPERLGAYLPSTALSVEILHDRETEDRRFVCLSGDSHWQQRLEGIGDL